MLQENAVTVIGYFPANNWYDYYDGSLDILEAQNGRYATLNAPIDYIPVHIRGGYIIPKQRVSQTTVSSRNTPFGLIVAPNDNGEAKGDLFYDDGESDLAKDEYFYATFSLNNNILRMHVEKNTYAEMNTKVLSDIRIFARILEGIKYNFVINDKDVISEENIRYEEHQIVLNNLNLLMTESFQIEWELEPFFGPNGFGPIIDCALDQPEITQEQCQTRGCMFLAESYAFLPNCFIPENRGGYVIKEEQNPGKNYLLVPADDFEIYPVQIVNEIELNIGFGITLGDASFKIARITVYNPLYDRFIIQNQYIYRFFIKDSR